MPLNLSLKHQPKRYLLLDGNNLAWRAFYAHGDLTHRDVPTAVVYGFFRDIVYLCQEHNTSDIVFCFDHGKGLRETDYPGYKGKRRAEELDEEKSITIAEVRSQVKKLKLRYLTDAGFRNVFYQQGYEADDVIASVVKRSLHSQDEAIIVSSDKDLYQLLSPRVRIWPPSAKQFVTVESFTNKYGISVEQWVEVKAMAGCVSDDVKGIPGIGEITAAKFLQGLVKQRSKTYDKIISGLPIRDRNLPIVKLPYPGTVTFEIRPDEVTIPKWQAVALRLGIRSIRTLFV